MAQTQPPASLPKPEPETVVINVAATVSPTPAGNVEAPEPVRTVAAAAPAPGAPKGIGARAAKISPLTNPSPAKKLGLVGTARATALAPPAQAPAVLRPPVITEPVGTVAPPQHQPMQSVIPYAAPGGALVAVPIPFIKDDDNISLADVVLPRMNIVQRTGQLSELFEKGSLLLNKELVIGNGDVPVKLAIVGFRPMQYAERVPGSSEMGNICDTPEEVENLGGTTSWDIHKTTQQHIYQKLATAMVIIEEPEGFAADDQFPYEIEGKKYAVALWGMKGTAFTHGAKNFFTARRFGALRTGYMSRWYFVSTRLKEYDGGNFAYIPVLKLGDPTPEGLRLLASEILS